MIRSFRPACAGLLLLSAVTGAAQANPDYVAAVARTNAMAAELQSYEVDAELAVTTGVAGMGSAMSLEFSIRTAARWPDRLVSRQEGTGFSMNLGTGPEHAWFHMGQMGTCYLGPSVTLNRDLHDVGSMELDPDRVYNFYAGLGQFMLDADEAVTAETGDEALTVGGREIPCQVFTSVPPAVADPNAPREGEKIYWFDPESGLILKARVTMHGNRNGTPVTQTLDYSVSRFALNEEVAEERFAFAAPAGVRVVDNFDRLTNPDAMTGMAAPDISFTDLDGNRLKVSDFRGKVLFIDFWATWCPPCKIEMPHIQTLWEEFGQRDDVMFLAASSEAVPTIKGFLAKQAYTFKVVTVSEQDAVGVYKATSIPAGFVIDREGVIRAHLIGAQTEAQLRQALAKGGLK